MTNQNKKIHSEQSHLRFKTELRQWANQVILEMNETALICDSDFNSKNEKMMKIKHLKISLSSLVDSGIMFLPISDTDKRIKKYNSENKGITEAILDLVDECYNYVDQISYKDSVSNSELQKRILYCKSKFVTEITKELHS